MQCGERSAILGCVALEAPSFEGFLFRTHLVTYMLPLTLEIRYWIDGKGTNPFQDWFDGLDSTAKTKVTVALKRLEKGNTSNVAHLSGGISELKIDFGPGYRIYFGQDGPRLVILVAGGTKKRQQRDIDASKERWQRYLASRTR